MDVSRLAASVLVGLIGGFITLLILWGFGVPTQPWSLLVGVLCALVYYFSAYRRTV